MVALRGGLLFGPIAPTLRATRVYIRLTHSTPVVLKKKDKKGAPSSRASFEDVENGSSAENSLEDDLFAFAKTSSTKIPKPRAAASTARAETFDSLLATTLQRFAELRKKSNPPRRSVVQQLLMTADTKEQLEQVLELAAVYRNAAIPLSTHEFFGRCMTLRCPELILQVLQNRPKYGMDIPSLESARTILNVLAMRKRDDPDAAMADCLAFAELYTLYGFAPASKDIISSLILAGVIARATAKNKGDSQPEDGSVVIVQDAFPEILEEVKAAGALWDSGSLVSRRERHWLRRSMGYIMPVARQQRHEQPWLHDLQERIRDI